MVPPQVLRVRHHVEHREELGRVLWLPQKVPAETPHLDDLCRELPPQEKLHERHE